MQTVAERSSSTRPGPAADTGTRPCVVLVVSNLEFGGTQRQVVELANNMDASRYHVHVCSLSPYVPLADRLQDRGRRLHVLHKRFKFDLSVVSRLARLLRNVKADVVHGFLFDADIAARLAARRARTKVVIGSERNTDYHLKRRQKIADRLTRRYVHAIIANSHAGARFHQRTLGHDPARYRVVPNGVDTEHFAPADGSAVRGELGIPTGDFVIGMFASFKPQKNHAMLFRAAGLLRRRITDFKLLLVGDELHRGLHGSSAYKERMAELIDRLGLGGQCVVAGNQDDVRRFYGACDVTVLPSRHEGTPNVLLESMACGVPVVATNLADNARIVPHDKLGFLVTLDDDRTMADQLLTLRNDRARRADMAAAAREWVVREFSTKRLAQRTQDVYDELLASRATT